MELEGTDRHFRNEEPPRPAVNALGAFVLFLTSLYEARILRRKRRGKQTEARVRFVAPGLTESAMPFHEPGENTTFSTEDEARRASK